MKRAVAPSDASRWDSAAKVRTTGEFADLSGGLHRDPVVLFSREREDPFFFNRRHGSSHLAQDASPLNAEIMTTSAAAANWRPC